jgi:hypothetical protein
MACLLLGLWLGAGLLMDWEEARNAGSADRVAAHPSLAAAVQIKTLGADRTTPLLHYVAAEQTRDILESWGSAQLFVGSLFFFFLLFGTSQGKSPLIVALLMVLIVFGERLLLVPEMLSRERALDFAAQIPVRQAAQLNVMHYAYVLAEVVKNGFGLILAGLMVSRSAGHRSFHARQEVYAVDEADYGHVNR